MRSALPVEPVGFSRPHTVYGDRGETRTDWERLGTFDCVVEPVEQPPVDDGLHPGGAKRTVRVHVPTALSGSLRGCRATVRGEEYDIEGDPLPYTASPLAFDRCAKAVRADG